jgi:hypothetical protein
MRKLIPFLRSFFNKFFDDLLMVIGCVCVLIGLSKWNVTITWVIGGLMLIGFGVLVGIGKARSKNVNNRPS